MKINNLFVSFLAGVAVTILLLHNFTCGESKDTVTVKSDTVVKITHQRDTIYKKQFVQIPVVTEIPVYIDTHSVIQDYYTYFNIKDTLKGKDYDVTLDDTLHMNRLFARRAHVHITRRDSFITTEITRYKSANGLYLGVQADLKSIAPSVLYLRGRSAYGIGFGTDKQVKASYFYRISK